MTFLHTLPLSDKEKVKSKNKLQELRQEPDPMAGVLLGVIHGAAGSVRRAGQQLTMADVHGEGLLVEGAHAPRHPTGVPSSKRAANVRDGGKGLADGDTLLLRVEMKFVHNIRLVSAALRAGNL